MNAFNDVDVNTRDNMRRKNTRQLSSFVLKMIAQHERDDAMMSTNDEHTCNVICDVCRVAFVSRYVRIYASIHKNTSYELHVCKQCEHTLSYNEHTQKYNAHTLYSVMLHDFDVIRVA